MTEELQGLLAGAPEEITYNPVYQVTYEGADPTRGFVYHLASLSAKDAEIAALRAALEPFAVAWTFADDADDDEVRCITKNGCHGVDVSAFRRAARALHENPESKA